MPDVAIVEQDVVELKKLMAFSGKYPFEAFDYFQMDETAMRKLLDKHGLQWTSFFQKVPSELVKPEITKVELQKFADLPMYKLLAYFKVSQETLSNKAISLNVKLMSMGSTTSSSDLVMHNGGLDEKTFVDVRSKKRKALDPNVRFKVEWEGVISEIVVSRADLSYEELERKVLNVYGNLKSGTFSLSYFDIDGDWCFMSRKCMEGCIYTSQKIDPVKLLVQRESEKPAVESNCS